MGWKIFYGKKAKTGLFIDDAVPTSPSALYCPIYSAKEGGKDSS